MISYFGWIGNAFLISGMALMSPRRRWPFLMTLVGEVVWLVSSVHRESTDMAFICVVFAVLAAVNYAKWGRQK